MLRDATLSFLIIPVGIDIRMYTFPCSDLSSGQFPSLKRGGKSLDEKEMGGASPFEQITAGFSVLH
jgi:hypothetical protein